MNNAVLDQLGEGLSQPYATVEKTILLCSVVHRHFAEPLDNFCDRVLVQVTDFQQSDQAY